MFKKSEIIFLLIKLIVYYFGFVLVTLHVIPATGRLYPINVQMHTVNVHMSELQWVLCICVCVYVLVGSTESYLPCSAPNFPRDQSHFF